MQQEETQTQVPRHLNQIVMLGDIHGAFRSVPYNSNRLNIENAIVIQVGDFGMGFHRPFYYADELNIINERLKLNNNHLYAIRGNHDDPSYFAETNNPFGCSNITLLADYSELDLLGHKFLFVGGAISVDRKERVLNKSYWADEPFVFRPEFDYKLYDCVVTHTRPAESGLFSVAYKNEERINADPELLRDLQEEMDLVSMLYEKTKPKRWFFGHFHMAAVGDNGITKFRCLDIDEFCPYNLDKPDASVF